MEKELPLKITDNALNEILRIIQSKGISDEYGLRIGIKGAGCIGVSYLLGFDTPKSNDDHFKWEDLDIYIQKKDMMYLVGLELDYYSGADAQGFNFIKPD